VTAPSYVPGSRGSRDSFGEPYWTEAQKAGNTNTNSTQAWKSESSEAAKKTKYIPGSRGSRDTHVAPIVLPSSATGGGYVPGSRGSRDSHGVPELKDTEWKSGTGYVPGSRGSRESDGVPQWKEPTVTSTVDHTKPVIARKTTVAGRQSTVPKSGTANKTTLRLLKKKSVVETPSEMSDTNATGGETSDNVSKQRSSTTTGMTKKASTTAAPRTSKSPNAARRSRGSLTDAERNAERHRQSKMEMLGLNEKLVEEAVLLAKKRVS
jgi:hypothetical protein